MWRNSFFGFGSTLLVVGLVLVAGCAADNPEAPDAFINQDFQVASDSLSCGGNNDGKIELSELLFDKTGLSASYLVNPPGTLQDVDVVGEAVGGKQQWDHSSTKGVVTKLVTETPKSFWFAEHYPAATLVIPDAKGENFQVLALDPAHNRMLLMGIASRKPDVTLMVYQPPVEVMRFPLQLGTSFTSSGSVENGKLNNLPIATNDTYEVSVDEEGTVLLPSLKFERTLRMKVKVVSKTVGGKSATVLQYQWFHECFGEIVRAVSETKLDGAEPPAAFTKATEYRRLTF